MNRRIASSVRGQSGFSLIELMIVVVIILIVAGIAMPNFFRAMRDYRLNNAASEVSNLIQQTRYQAVRMNRDITARADCPGVVPLRVWIDLNNNGAYDVNPVDVDGDGRPDGTEGIVMLNPEIVFGPAGAPGAATMGAAYALTATPPVCGAGAGTGITFNSRGVVDAGPLSPVLFMTLGYRNQPQWGFRAITLTPMGKSKLWKGTQAGWTDR